MHRIIVKTSLNPLINLVIPQKIGVPTSVHVLSPPSVAKVFFTLRNLFLFKFPLCHLWFLSLKKIFGTTNANDNYRGNIFNSREPCYILHLVYSIIVMLQLMLLWQNNHQEKFEESARQCWHMILAQHLGGRDKLISDFEASMVYSMVNNLQSYSETLSLKKKWRIIVISTQFLWAQYMIVVR